ncbi:MAG: thioesterase [Oscillospiraceae bacterium]|nr:thioesterase [Oscillospiraceae bacterium]
MLLCFLPHAGGSAKSYSSFRRFLPKSLNVLPMELSGRFTRSDEPVLTEISACAGNLLDKHQDVLMQEPYALFGHSMGTLLSTELVRQAKKRGMPLPVHVFLSGRCAPDDAVKPFGNIEQVSDAEIVNFFSGNGLTQNSPIQDDALMQMLNRTLCTDVRMAERYAVSPEDVKFPCDMTVLYGTEDTMLTGESMHGWERFAEKSCEVLPFSGGHFYYAEHKPEICKIITSRLSAYADFT